jgi:hypothetical protein
MQKRGEPAASGGGAGARGHFALPLAGVGPSYGCGRAMPREYGGPAPNVEAGL